jgi:hypothetical protein
LTVLLLPRTLAKPNLEVRGELGDGIYEFLRTFSSPFPVVASLELQAGSKPRTAAKAGTTGCARAFRRAFDWQQRCRLR